MIDLAALGTVAGTIMFLATFVEGTVEYLFAGRERVRPYLQYIAVAFGIGLAVAYNIDIPSMFGLAVNYGIISNIVSGVIIGRGSNYVSDLLPKRQG